MVVHVGDAGAANTGGHQAAAQAIIAADPNLDQLTVLATDALPGTNVDVDKVERYQIASAIIDARALAIARAGGDRAAGLAAFAARSWSARREAFEDLWVDGRSFIYFAPNPGTAGVIGFGRFCLVIDSNRVLNEDSAVFPSDTAQRYTDASANVDTALAFAEVGVWESRADLAVIELAAEPPEQWPDLLCGKDRYLEVVTVGPIRLEDVIQLRVTQDQADELDDLWWAWRAGTLSKPDELRTAKAYNALLRWPKLQRHIV